MQLRHVLLAAPAALALACGGSGTSNLDAATPSYSTLALDQVSADTSPAALTAGLATGTASALTLEPAAAPSGALTMDWTCHPHLFLRQREVVERVNRHIYKVLRHVEEIVATRALSATDASKVWERVVNGTDVKFTITLLAPGRFAWELDAGPVGTSPLPVVMTGDIDRNGATGAHQGKGSMHLDFARLAAVFPGERVTQGTIDVHFDVTAGSRKLTVTAANVAWDLDPLMFDSASVLAALSAPRSGSYVYDREYGKGGSLKIQDQMVFACPANPSLVAADAQLVSRWYRAGDGAVHGRSDGLMTNGQLPAAGVDRVVAVTCHQGSAEATMQAESFWLMKAEAAGGATLAGVSSALYGGAGETACDPVFGDVPLLADAGKDFTGWPASYSDGVPFPFPGM